MDNKQSHYQHLLFDVTLDDGTTLHVLGCELAAVTSPLDPAQYAGLSLKLHLRVIRTVAGHFLCTMEYWPDDPKEAETPAVEPRLCTSWSDIPLFFGDTKAARWLYKLLDLKVEG